MSKAINDFYLLSEMLGDDLVLVANIIHENYPKKTKLSAVAADVEENSETRMEKYQEAINKILNMPWKDFKTLTCKEKPFVKITRRFKHPRTGREYIAYQLAFNFMGD